MRKINDNLIFSLCIAMLFTACGERSSQTDGNRPVTGIDSAWVPVTQIQFDAMGMQLDTLREISFSEKLRVNGYILSSVNGQAQVTSRLSGPIRQIFFEPGDYAAAGSTLCTIESNDFLELQQNFIDISARYREARAAYERLASLYADTITSKREFMAAESAYQGLSAQYEGMKQRLALLNVNPENVEKGNLQPLLNITAPIGGHITQVNCMPGEYVTPDKSLMTMVDMSRLYLQLDVYEKDIPKLAPGQLVEFYHPDYPSQKQHAHLTRIGKTTDPEKKTVACIANFEEDAAKFIHNLYVEADVILSDRNGPGIPEQALVSSGEAERIYLLAKKEGENYYFEPFQVITGMRSGDYVEIINPVPDREILVEGVYNLPAAE
jgi:cobalt-zinc-cadmium efflux system membrane fusion protein